MVKKCKVILIPTREPTTLFTNRDDKIMTAKLESPPLHGIRDLGWIPRHLYVFRDITSMDELIATTDLTHHLMKNGERVNFPTVSEQFKEKYVKAYNNGTPIIDVLVEYLENGQPKINPRDNTITIRKIKELYTRADIDAMIEDIRQPFQYEIRRTILERKNNWLNENL